MKIKKEKLTKILYYFVLLSFVLPIVFLVVRLIMTANAGESAEETRSRSDYVLMLLECLLGVAVIHIPMLLSKKFRIVIPTVMYVLYIIFLYCAIFLGEVRDFYYVIPHWDDILHSTSSIMTGFFGFMLVSILNRDENIKMNLPPLFVSLFAFCFAVMIGTAWEIYEFAADGILSLNMQKFMLRDGTLLVGHDALRDTMKDIIIDTCGAFLATVIGFFSIKNQKGWINSYIQSNPILPKK